MQARFWEFEAGIEAFSTFENVESMSAIRGLSGASRIGNRPDPSVPLRVLPRSASMILPS